MASQPPEISKQTFLDLAAQAGIEGDDERLEALYQDVKVTLSRTAALFDVDTTGVEPSPINPQFEAGP